MVDEFTLPAEFRTGAYLSAMQLNQLSDAVAYLHGRATAPMMARSSIVTDTELTSTNNIWRIRHKDGYNDIHYSMKLNTSNLSGSVKIVLTTEDGAKTAQYTVETNPSAGWSETGHISTGGAIDGRSLNDGEWYQIYVDTPGGSNYTFEVHYLDESNDTSLNYPTPQGASWSAQPEWSHGDAPATGKLQAYTDGLDYIYDLVGDAGRNPAVLVDREHGPQGTDHEDSGLTFVHLQPWLIFRGSGEIIHPTDSTTNPSVSIGDEDELTVFDLSAVPWLQYGDIYRVFGCTWACEAMDAG